MKIKRYADLAQLVPRCCGCKLKNDGTVVLAHRNRNGWGLLFGKASKSLSLSGAFLCYPCHQYGDGAEGRNDHDWWELAVQRSLTWAWQSGYLRFSSVSSDVDKALR